MEVARSRGQVAVAQQALDGVDVDAGLEQMGGKGVAQTMDAALFADTGCFLGAVVDALGSAHIDRQIMIACLGKQPSCRGLAHPVKA